MSATIRAVGKSPPTTPPAIAPTLEELKQGFSVEEDDDDGEGGAVELWVSAYVRLGLEMSLLVSVIADALKSPATAESLNRGTLLSNIRVDENLGAVQRTCKARSDKKGRDNTPTRSIYGHIVPLLWYC